MLLSFMFSTGLILDPELFTVQFSKFTVMSCFPAPKSVYTLIVFPEELNVQPSNVMIGELYVHKA